MKKDSKNTEKKFHLTFKMGLLIYVVVAIILIGIGMGFFWKFIGDYEDGQPIHTMEKVVKDFEKADITKLINSSKIDMVSNPFEVADGEGNKFLAEKFNSYLNGKKITFVKAKKYTDKNPVYVVKADGESIAEVELTSKKRNSSNFKIWEFESLNLADYISKVIKTSDIKVQVPEGTVITVNGKEVADSYKVGEADIPELKEVSPYMENPPKMYTYEIKGFTAEPTVSASLNGEALQILKEENVYTGTFTSSEEFVNEMSSYADEVAVAYAKNFINVQKKILPYVLKESDLYTSIKSATTAWYPNSKIKSYEFTEKEISNFQVYSDDCFSCDVKYILEIKFVSGYKVDDPTETGDFKFFFVQKEGKWYLASLTYNYEE